MPRKRIKSGLRFLRCPRHSHRVHRSMCNRHVACAHHNHIASPTAAILVSAVRGVVRAERMQLTLNMILIAQYTRLREQLNFCALVRAPPDTAMLYARAPQSMYDTGATKSIVCCYLSRLELPNTNLPVFCAAPRTPLSSLLVVLRSAPTSQLHCVCSQ